MIITIYNLFIIGLSKDSIYIINCNNQRVWCIFIEYLLHYTQFVMEFVVFLSIEEIVCNGQKIIIYKMWSCVSANPQPKRKQVFEAKDKIDHLRRIKHTEEYRLQLSSALNEEKILKVLRWIYKKWTLH